MLGTVIKYLAQVGTQTAREDKMKADISKLKERQEEIIDLILAGYDLDTIASAYEEKYGINPPHTILLASSFVKDLAHDQDPRTLDVANAIAARQRVDSNVPAIDFVRQLDDSKTIFLADKCRKELHVRLDQPNTSQISRFVLTPNLGSDQDWVPTWREFLRLACIAEGTLLIDNHQN